MPAKRREDIDDDEVCYLYNVEKWTLQKIADYYGVTHPTIYYRLHPEKLKEHHKKRKDAMKEWYGKNRDHILEQMKKYQQTEKGKAAISKHDAKRRELGFIQVNSWFEGGHWHHIDLDHVICMPEEVHKSIYHNIWTDEGMEEINEVAFGYITDEEFEKLESGELDK